MDVTEDEDVYDLFQRFGNITYLFLNPETGKDDGYANVHFEHRSEAEDAINSLNRTQYGGSRSVILVKFQG